jgi:hypothetical protein
MTSSRRSAVEAPEYQSLSVLAIISLVLGAASLVALAAPLLLVLGGAAIGFGLLALSAIRRSEGAMTGANVARLGMALAVAAAAAIWVRGALRDSLMKGQASAVAQTWIELLADQQFEDAREMMSNAAIRSLLPDPMTRQTPLTAEEADNISLRRLQNDPLTKALAGKAIAIAEGATDPLFDGPRAMVTARYVVGVPGGLHRHAELHVVRERQFEAGGQPWRIEAWGAGEAHGAH